MQEEVTRGAVTLIVDGAKLSEQVFEKAVKKFLEEIQKSQKPNLSETVIVPIAGVILTFVMCYELIQLVTEKNNLHDVDTWMFFKWIFKTFCAVLIVTNTWNIVMGIFDVGQSVVNSSAGVIIGNTSIDISSVITDMEAQLEALGTGELFGLWFQSLFVGLTMNALSI